MPDGGGYNGEEATSSSPLTFHSENIGQWSSKQEGLFDEQNRRAAEQIKLRQAKLRRLRPFILAGSGLLVVLVIIASIMLAFIPDQLPPLPGNITLGSAGAVQVAEDAKNVYREQLQKFYNKHNDGEVSGTIDNPSEDAEKEALSAMSDYFDRQKDRTDDDSVKTDLSIIEMQEYSYKGKPNEIIRVGESLDTDKMSELQKIQVWSLLSDAYYGIHDYDNGNRYFDLAISGDTEEDNETQ